MGASTFWTFFNSHCYSGLLLLACSESQKIGGCTGHCRGLWCSSLWHHHGAIVCWLRPHGCSAICPTCSAAHNPVLLSTVCYTQPNILPGHLTFYRVFLSANPRLCFLALHLPRPIQATSPSSGTATAAATWTPSWRSLRRWVGGFPQLHESDCSWTTLRLPAATCAVPWPQLLREIPWCKQRCHARCAACCRSPQTRAFRSTRPQP